MIGIVDLESAKQHLRITNTDQDTDIMRKIMYASQTVVGFLKIALDSPPVWPPSSASDDIVTVAEMLTFLALSELNENRESGVVNVLSDAFVRLGSLYRLPTLA